MRQLRRSADPRLRPPTAAAWATAAAASAAAAALAAALAAAMAAAAAATAAALAALTEGAATAAALAAAAEEAAAAATSRSGRAPRGAAGAACHRAPGQATSEAPLIGTAAGHCRIMDRLIPGTTPTAPTAVAAPACRRRCREGLGPAAACPTPRWAAAAATGPTSRPRSPPSAVAAGPAAAAGRPWSRSTAAAAAAAAVHRLPRPRASIGERAGTWLRRTLWACTVKSPGARGRRLLRRALGRFLAGAQELVPETRGLATPPGTSPSHKVMMIGVAAKEEAPKAEIRGS